MCIFLPADKTISSLNILIENFKSSRELKKKAIKDEWRKRGRRSSHGAERKK